VQEVLNVRWPHKKQRKMRLKELMKLINTAILDVVAPEARTAFLRRAGPDDLL